MSRKSKERRRSNRRVEEPTGDQEIQPKSRRAKRPSINESPQRRVDVILLLRGSAPPTTASAAASESVGDGMDSRPRAVRRWAIT